MFKFICLNITYLLSHINITYLSYLVVKISGIQPDSPALYSRNNHKSKWSIKISEKISDTEAFLSLQVWMRYTGGFEQVSTC